MLARNIARNGINKAPLTAAASVCLSRLWPRRQLPDGLKRVLLVLALGSSHALYAQGLGELTLESTLNEPLQASIELLDVSGLDPEQLVIRLASPEEYEQAGLEYSEFLTNIDMSTSIAAAGNGVLSLRSERRVDEPFLSLLVNARWPAGRVMREYTVLLDLPGQARRAALPSSLPVSAAPRPATASSPSAATSRPAVAASSSQPEAGSHTVGSGESLWAIAAQTRPSAAVSVPQMMLAIQRANEDAFVNNDINRLLSGRVLRIPPQNEIAMVDAGEALALVNAPRPAGAAVLGMPAANPATARAEDTLSVLTSDDAVDAAGSSDLQATIAALENALLLSEEELDRARLQNEDLTAQLGELEEQIAILQNIVAIENERLASLQQNLAAQAEAATFAMAQGEQLSQSLASQPPAASQGLLGRVMQLLANNLVALGIALLLVILVLAMLLQRARQARLQNEEDDELDFDDEIELERYESGGDEFGEFDDQDGPEELAEDDSHLDRDGSTASVAAVDPSDAGGPLAPRSSDQSALIIEDGSQDDIHSAVASAIAVDDGLAEFGEAAAGDIIADGIESFDFKLDPVAPPQPAAVDNTINETIETLDFGLPAADGKPQDATSLSGMDNFTFDENDITFDDDDDVAYTPRTNMDEYDTKLDLAVAYEAMGDMVGAVEILEEVIAGGKPEQVAEAQGLKLQWQGV